jgi:hypothetical protein
MTTSPLAERPNSNDRVLPATRGVPAIFCLLAVTRIRERTNNQKGLEARLCAMLADGNIESEWPFERAIAIGDKATGVPVLHPLLDSYESYKTHTAPDEG